MGTAGLEKLAFSGAFIAADHGGLALKEALKPRLSKLGVELEDLGTYGTGACDYPDYALKVAKKVAAEKGSAGILICGTGIGMCITANKVRGIRAAQCWNVETARLAREHNNANVLCLGGRLLKTGGALKITETFLRTKFTGEERHARRVKKIGALP